MYIECTSNKVCICLISSQFYIGNGYGELEKKYEEFNIPELTHEEKIRLKAKFPKIVE